MCPICNKEMKLQLNNITTIYRDKYIKVSDVPLYTCDCQAVNFARKTRIQIKQRLKEAFDGELDEIAY